MWISAVHGVSIGIGMLVMNFAYKRGWLKPTFYGSPEHEQRTSELAAERERIVAESKMKLKT